MRFFTYLCLYVDFYVIKTHPLASVVENDVF